MFLSVLQAVGGAIRGAGTVAMESGEAIESVAQAAGEVAINAPVVAETAVSGITVAQGAVETGVQTGNIIPELTPSFPPHPEAAQAVEELATTTAANEIAASEFTGTKAFVSLDLSPTPPETVTSSAGENTDTLSHVDKVQQQQPESLNSTSQGSSTAQESSTKDRPHDELEQRKPEEKKQEEKEESERRAHELMQRLAQEYNHKKVLLAEQKNSELLQTSDITINAIEKELLALRATVSPLTRPQIDATIISLRINNGLEEFN